jgi:hypothetical protein
MAGICLYSGLFSFARIGQSGCQAACSPAPPYGCAYWISRPGKPLNSLNRIEDGIGSRMSGKFLPGQLEKMAA